MTDPPEFVPGLELARLVSEAAVQIVEAAAPGLRFSTALIGPGSDVLGFDTAMSMDHDWGPRLQIFVPDETEELLAAVRIGLDQQLPREVAGFSLHFGVPPPGGNASLATWSEGEPFRHRVAVERTGSWFEAYLGLDPRQDMSATDWLSLPSQKLRSVVAGGVFHDRAGLEEIRRRLAWYPVDITRYMMASSWARIGEDEHLMGRAGYVGDELGARLIAGDIAREAMRLCFLLEQQYPPYAKWFGTGFRLLASALAVSPLVNGLLEARGWQARDVALVALLERLAELQNNSGLALAIDPAVRPFHLRPFHVIDGERFARSLVESIDDEEVRRITNRRLIGNIDQVSANTNFLEDRSRRGAIKQLWE